MSEPILSIKISHTEERLLPTKHTVYVISLNGPVRNWIVHKRYSEFEALDKSLSSIGETNLSFPPKIMLAFADSKQLESRKLALEGYLQGILYHKNNRFRNSKEWFDFLNVPEIARKKQEHGLEELSRKIDDTPLNQETWLNEYSSIQTFLTQIRACLNVRDQFASNADVGAYQSAKLQAKKAVGVAYSRLERLDSSLNTKEILLPINGFPISKAEIRRRKDLVLNLKSEIDQLHALAEKITNVQIPTSSSSERAQLLSNSLKSSRKFGVGPVNETSQTRSLDNEQLLQLQKSQMQEQDKNLEMLAKVVKRQKEIGLAMSEELDAQNQLLEQLDDDASRVSGNLKFADERIKKLFK